jgi:hypothetical protein
MKGTIILPQSQALLAPSIVEQSGRAGQKQTIHHHTMGKRHSDHPQGPMMSKTKDQVNNRSINKQRMGTNALESSDVQIFSLKRKQ